MPARLIDGLLLLVAFGAGWVSYGLGAALIHLSPAFDSSSAKQAWHDMAAKTMAIRTR
ncbi:MAG: hypothetical protein ACRDQ7_17685 [Haloechinothrix sp.]